MPSAFTRAVLGFIAAAISVLTFHQGIVGLYYLAHAAGRPWSLAPVPPFGVPRVLDLCFWGGLYGIGYGLIWPWLAVPRWFSGILLGFLAVAVLWLVVAPLKGAPLGFGWHADGMIRSLIINGGWGLGVGLILPRIMPRSTSRRRHARMRTG
ncbi:MAG TPA: hypothetical protein VGG99_20480 [Acetobacteraceae bacterium]|jgi:hypothetical protein